MRRWPLRAGKGAGKGEGFEWVRGVGRGHGSGSDTRKAPLPRLLPVCIEKGCPECCMDGWGTVLDGKTCPDRPVQTDAGGLRVSVEDALKLSITLYSYMSGNNGAASMAMSSSCPSCPR